MIRRQQWIRDVAQVDFILTNSIFGDSAAHRYALLGRCGSNTAEKRRAVIDGVHRQVRRTPRRAAAPRQGCERNPTVSATRWIQQVKLELAGDYGVHTGITTLGGNRREYHSRIEPQSLAGGGMAHAAMHLCDRGSVSYTHLRAHETGR